MTKPSHRVTLLGMPIDALSEEEVIAHVQSALRRGTGGWVITSNLDQLRQFVQSGAGDIRAMFHEADLVLADGMPLLWATKLQGSPLPERVPGSGLIWTLTEAIAENGGSIYLVGGNPGVAERAAKELHQRFPQLGAIGTAVPPFGFEQDAQAVDAIRHGVTRCAPSVVYVALGFPKQERLIEQIRHAAPNAWFIGVGISLSFVSGDITRAPMWIQRIGLEWAHRLKQEPGRLFRRYLIQDFPFVFVLLIRALYSRIARQRVASE